MLSPAKIAAHPLPLSNLQPDTPFTNSTQRSSAEGQTTTTCGPAPTHHDPHLHHPPTPPSIASCPSSSHRDHTLTNRFPVTSASGLDRGARPFPIQYRTSTSHVPSTHPLAVASSAIALSTLTSLALKKEDPNSANSNAPLTVSYGPSAHDQTHLERDYHTMAFCVVVPFSFSTPLFSFDQCHL